MAGVAAAGFVEGVMISLMCVTTTGCSALIAQALGAKDKKKSFQIARESIHLSILFSLFLTLFILIGGPYLLQWMSLAPVSHHAATVYLKFYAFGNIVYYLLFISGQIFNAHGDTKTSVSILALVLVLNGIIDPFFILGWGGFPALGVQGAGLTSLICCAFGMFLRCAYLRKREYIDEFRTFLTFSHTFMLNIAKIGIPTSLSRVIWSSVYPLLTTLITRFGMAPLAGLTMGHRIEGIAYFTAYGFSIAMITLVGESVGKNDLVMAKRYAYRGRFIVSLFLLPVTLLFTGIPHWLIGLTSSDPEVIQNGAAYLRTVGITEILLGWEMIFEGSFSGLGNTRTYMFISVPLTLGRYPIAYILINKCGYGVGAVWIAISLSTALKGIIMSIVFKSARPRITVKSLTMKDVKNSP